MIEILKQKNYDATHFQPFTDYIAYLESLGYKHISTEESHGDIIEKYEGVDHNLKIITMKDTEKEWISIYKSRTDEGNFEMIDFMILYEEYQKRSNCWDYNRIIKYAAHFEDEEFTSMVCSGYTYQDDNLLSGWRKLRKFAVDDLYKVIYSKNMPLSELVMCADMKINKFEEEKNLEGNEVKELILGY